MTAAVAAGASWRVAADGRVRGLVAALGWTLRRALRLRLRCLILGHDDALARGSKRLLLRCAACGRETAGWAVGPESHDAGQPGSRTFDRHLAPPPPSVRTAPWRLRRHESPAVRRERQRQRLVAAASRLGS
jgi:hypothetical protein